VFALSSTIPLAAASMDRFALPRPTSPPLGETIAAKPTARNDAKWGQFLITPAMFTGLVLTNQLKERRLCRQSQLKMERRSITRIGGKGKPIVFSHGWPLSADAWEDQMNLPGCPRISLHCTRSQSHGRSSSHGTVMTMDTYRTTSPSWSQRSTFAMRSVGHSTGGGEVARYIGRHGTKRVAKAVLISAVRPDAEDGRKSGGLAIEHSIRYAPRAGRPVAAVPRSKRSFLRRPIGRELQVSQG